MSKTSSSTLRKEGMDMTEEVKKRLAILAHWQEFGLKSAMNAFQVSRSTLYAWRKKLNEANGNHVALQPQSKHPQKIRCTTWNPRVLERIKRLREWQPNLNKDRVFIRLKWFCKQYHLPLAYYEHHWSYDCLRSRKNAHQPKAQP